MSSPPLRVFVTAAQDQTLKELRTDQYAFGGKGEFPMSQGGAEGSSRALAPKVGQHELSGFPADSAQLEDLADRELSILMR
jgi:hypothetical protein